jgi:hypothetical protein
VLQFLKAVVLVVLFLFLPISIAVLCAPSNRGGVKSTMWIAPGINFFRWIGPSSSA